MRMVSGLIEIDHDIITKEFIPKGTYYTVSEYAKIKSINESTLRSLISRGKIDSYFLYGKRLIPAISQKKTDLK